MNSEMYHPYERFLAYDIYLRNDVNGEIYIDNTHETGTSIAYLAQALNLPIQVVRADFLCLQKTLNYTAIANFEDSDPFLSSPAAEALIDLWESCSPMKDFEQAVLSGQFDELPLEHDFKNKPNVSSDTIALPLTKDEQQALSLLDAGLFSVHSSTKIPYSMDYLVKNSYRYNLGQGKLMEWLNITHDAIKKHSLLSIVYHGDDKRIIQKFHPLKIVYDSFENEYAIISRISTGYDVYRFDRIQKLTPCPASTKPEKTLETLEQDTASLSAIAPTVWGFCFSDEPVRVVVRFYNDSPVNVWSKIKNDLFYRTNGKLYEKDDFLYYEDDVRGLPSFLGWLYSYGASAEIMEPLSLREEAIRSYQNRLKRHGLL